MKVATETVNTKATEVWMVIEDFRQFRMAVPGRIGHRQDKNYFHQAINLSKSYHNYLTEEQLMNAIQDIDRPCLNPRCATDCDFANDGLLQSTLNIFKAGLNKGFFEARETLMPLTLQYTYGAARVDAALSK